MTGYQSKKAAAQDKLELTLQEQLDIASAAWRKAGTDYSWVSADWRKADADLRKARADLLKARAEIDRIINLMEKNT